MSDSNPAAGDEHLPSRNRLRLPTGRPQIVAAAAVAAVLIIGGVAFAVTNNDPERDTVAPTSTTREPTSSTEVGNSTTATSVDDATSSTSDSRTTTGATSTVPPALTTVPGQTLPTSPPDTSPDTTLPDPKPTSPPAPSTTGPDTRSTVEAYSQEYERYCRNAFGIAPDGVLHDPDFIDDTYTVEDCLYWLDPEWGEFFDTAAEAAQGGIDDAISTMEDMTSLSGALCWIDAETEQWGGCWVTPNG